MDLHKRMRARLQPKADTGRWYDIKADAGGAVVRIYSEIGYWGVTAEDFAADLAQISAAQIEVQINSPGGDVFDGLAIYNALRAHPARIVTRVDGLAASAASVIVQAGDHRQIMSSAQIMIHEAWGLAVGPAAELREFADLLDKQNDVLAAIYAERSGGDADAFRALMAAETWMTDQEAVDGGLADEVYVPVRQEAAAASLAGAATWVNGLTSAATITATVPGDPEPPATQISDAVGIENPEPAPAESDIEQDAARTLLAAFTLEGAPQ